MPMGVCCPDTSTPEGRGAFESSPAVVPASRDGVPVASPPSVPGTGPGFVASVPSMNGEASGAALAPEVPHPDIAIASPTALARTFACRIGVASLSESLEVRDQIRDILLRKAGGRSMLRRCARAEAVGEGRRAPIVHQRRAPPHSDERRDLELAPGTHVHRLVVGELGPRVAGRAADIRAVEEGLPALRRTGIHPGG